MEDEKVTCPVCGMEFDNKEAHDTHHKEAHPDEPMPEGETGGTASGEGVSEGTDGEQPMG